ncbi:hypothetical protein M436DRAFT_39764 [Aureobasidium namibiae CBS 147.97]|uniref:Leucine-rich repeat domain-containing protein n=1 Tax=Aureobasidium namibiae CBS 147.97 TaxID=1043004 RepID=A0A074WWD1_9PEZI
MVYLPNEIWLKVAGYFYPPLDLCTRESETVKEHDRVVQRTLISLCLVSKQLRAIFQPRLSGSFTKYSRSNARNLLLESDSEWRHKYYQCSEQNFIRKTTRLEYFLRTLIERPDLAVMVEQLRIGWFVEDSALEGKIQKLYERLSLHGTLASTFVDTLRTFQGFERMSIETRRSWLKDLRSGEEQAEVALLLVILPSLRFLRIESRRGDLTKYVRELHDALVGPRPTSWTIVSGEGMLRKRRDSIQSQSQLPPQILKALESLNVWSNCHGEGSLERCVDLLSLPSLTSIDARGLEQWHKELWPWPKPNIDLTSLQNLTLVHCRLSGSAITDLLTKCTGLRSLTLNSQFAFNPEEEAPFLGTTVYTALQNLAGTLERLTMMVPEYITDPDLDLTSFKNLRHLEVDQHLLLYNQGQANMHKNLPTSIQQLVVRRTSMLIKPSLEAIFNTFEPTPDFPNLAALKLFTLYEGPDKLEEDLIGLRIRAQQLSVGFEWEGEPGHNYSEFWHVDSDSEEDLASEHFHSDEENSDDDD